MTLLHKQDMQGRLDEILGSLAEELINYDSRMVEAKAPNIRFVYKYNKAAKTKILQLLEAYTEDRVLEAKQEQITQDQLSFLTEFDIDELKLIEWRLDALQQLKPKKDKV